MTPSDDARRFFDGIAGRYERVYGLPSAESRRRMTRVLGELPAAPARILDLGVGTGRELSALLDAGYHPTGVDLSPAMLARCARRSRPVDLVEADFWRPLPFDDASFDSALALHGTLAHAPDVGALSRLAREVARVVRQGGAW
ncbi:MAG: methyltransferase domain-containing protein, partial [Myxococcota bacterium]|nr:methyltransferase domain-containing protein [Myxococcota bacterium]